MNVWTRPHLIHRHDGTRPGEVRAPLNIIPRDLLSPSAMRNSQLLAFYQALRLPAKGRHLLILYVLRKVRQQVLNPLQHFLLLLTLLIDLTAPFVLGGVSECDIFTILCGSLCV